ncbi:MAG: carboxypeptidase-like regulatory domain-containing protein, partial [Candidatus Diapherotrites archaeon]|nr:carboxypeptidase-like regulatory domain-containing protein [Candidatus Diapherotrites archaeon]
MLESVDLFLEAHAVSKRNVVLGSLVGAIVLASLWVYLQPAAQQTTQLVVYVTDDANHPLSNATITLTVPKKQVLETDANGTATISAVLGTRLSFSVGKAGYTTKTVEHILRAGVNRVTVSLSALSQTLSRKIVFSDDAGHSIAGTALLVRISCTDPVSWAGVSQQAGSDGVLSFLAPAKCPGLVVSVVSPAQFAGFSYVLDADTTVIALKRVSSAAFSTAGSVRVQLASDDNGLLDAETEILLFSQQHEWIASALSAHGAATFNGVLRGAYTVIVHETTGQFRQSAPADFTVAASEKKQVTVPLMKSETRLVLVVQDRESGSRIGFGRIVVWDPSQLKIGTAGLVGSDGTVTLALESSDVSGLVAQVAADGYLLSTTPLSDLSQTIGLEKTTAANTVRVQVLDAQGERVENARVFVVDTTSKTVFSAAGFWTTDRMGNALLYGVPTGATVYGEKGFA